MSWSVAHFTNAIVTYYMVSKHIEFIFAKYLHTPVVLLDQINRLWLDHALGEATKWKSFNESSKANPVPKKKKEQKT